MTEESYNNIKACQLYGIYPFSFYKALEALKKDGKRLIYDIDDALDLIDPSNPFYYAVKKDAGSAMEILPYIDHITAATPKLKEYISKKTNAPVTVIPNCFDMAEQQFARPKRTGIRIGFVGASPHVPDLTMVLPAVRKAQERHPEVVFIIMGFGKESYAEWYGSMRRLSSDEGLKELESFDKALAGIRFEWVPFVDYEIYPRVLANMSLDIGLCPIKDMPFNEHRSTSKAMEYTLSGALAMASNRLPFTEDQSSYLVDDGQWEKELEHFIVNPELRAMFHKRHYDWVMGNRNIEGQLANLKTAYGII